ncbi:MAG: phosphoenolpyruvate carboxylase [Ignavibacteriae bacterium]|nr:phosphoenolpyruvate carboxylase [Ignavibacteriota bacterium]NOG96380.1 phosphoenolpyruvate carboxylase [Ignavibacteriota bacterium]
MDIPLREKEFEKLVKNKFNVYNSLFLSLPFRKITNTGMIIPLMHHVCKQGLESGKDPLEILDSFFDTNVNIHSEEEKIDFMFRVIQYIERQVVLYDSVEDAAFPHLLNLDDDLSLKDYIHLAANKKDAAGVREKLSKFSARIVFTAHPTQFYSSSVLDIIAKLRGLINENDIDEIDITLHQLGLTSLINSQKPTPFDEAKNIIYFLRNVFYDAVGELYSNIKKNINDISFDNSKIIELGFWPGGDRDGNPFVKSDTTNAVADELRMTLMKCYYKDVKNLSQKLTFSEVEDVVANLRENLYAAMFDAAKILSLKEIIEPLYSVQESLIKNYNSLYLDELNTLIDKVKIFKIHFAALDIRQNHSVHKRTIEEILKKKKLINDSLNELNREELISILIQKKISVLPEDFDDELLSDTIQSIIQLRDIQNKNGEEGCSRYIISHSEDIFSILFVFALFRWCGWNDELIPFDFIPLFESMEGMENSETIMRELFDITEYKAHLKQRNNKQTIMLGFSDGTKDGGYLKANWSIFKTKENLSALCERHNIKAIFFDGRGGPPARGGGKTHRFYAAQSERIANHAIQLTIQGQTITSKYGTKEHFIHNCEQLLTAGLSNSLHEKENNIPDKSRKLIEELARISFNKYSDLKNHKMFLPYLENKSTLKYYGETNIGSRPAKRGDKEKLDFNDLRAIPFVGSWSQLRQNVPGYFGIGTALKELINEGKLEELKNLFNDVPFFKAMLLNSMMSLSKCYFELTAYIAKDNEYKDFWNILFEEYKLAKEMVLQISGYNRLMEEEPISRKSIAIRESIVLPLLVIQQYALQKIEQNSDKKETYEKIVKRSLYGNINASRNSA